MSSSIRRSVLLAMSGFALAAIGLAGPTNVASVIRPLQVVVYTNDSNVFSSGLINIQGHVVSKATTGSVEYASWLMTEFVQNGERKENEERFRPHDLSLRTVAPGATNMFVGQMGGMLSDYQFYGKGMVFAYATPEGTNGIANRISNLIIFDVDMDKCTLTLREDRP